MARFVEHKQVVLRSTLEVIPDISALPRVGAGHDGRVFRFNDKALKLLKYDISLRKEKNLMTFSKATYFLDELDLKRIIKPIDILLDSEGVYTGYVMEYLDDVTNPKKKDSPIYREPEDFSCGELINSIHDLIEDFNELTRKNVLAADINRGSYIFTTDFMHLCDMDKYQKDLIKIDDQNKRMLNYVIAKFLAIVMSKKLSKEQLKLVNEWVKKSANSRRFLESLEKEIGSDYRVPIGDFATYKVKKLIQIK